MWGIQRSRCADCDPPEASEGREVAVNVGGVKQLLRGDVLRRFPETRLAELLDCSLSEEIPALCDDYDSETGEFYFDRDPEAFKCIVELYYYGEIHMKRGICPICFMKEMEYWRVGADHLDDCCKCQLQEVQDELAEIAEKVRTILVDREGDPHAGGWQRVQAGLWRLMEKPESSLPAHVIAIVSFVFILVSSVVMCVGTIPDLQVEDAEGTLTEHPTLEMIETVCIGWFTVEYVLRLVSSPNKLKFILAFMNIIDFMAIMPFYVVLVLTSFGAGVMELANVQQAVQALRIMRIARIFKLARHSSGLQTLTSALKSSFKELGLLLMYMGVGVFLFSALGYTMEQNHPDTLFTSIPQSFWWAVITMTTVGYGDVYPKTTLGRCNAAISFLCGVIAIALPIHPIINNFVLFYNKQQVLETAAKHEIELMALRSCHAGEGTSRPVHVCQSDTSRPVHVCQSDTLRPVHACQSDTLRPVHMCQSDTLRPVHMCQSDTSRPVHVCQSDTSRPVHVCQSDTLRPVHVCQSDTSRPVHVCQSDTLRPVHVCQSDTLLPSLREPRGPGVRSASSDTSSESTADFFSS